jgi:hypothetical protein
MLVAILVAVFFTTGEGISDNSKDGNLDESKKYKMPLKVIIMVGSVLILFIIYMVYSSKSYMEQAKKGNPQVSYTSRVSKQEYESITKEATEREIEKLMRNPKFQKMVEEKGDEPKNWIWQTKEKEKKTVYRDRESSCDEDNLSEITLSDD